MLMTQADTVLENCNQKSPPPNRLEELLARYGEPVRAIVHRNFKRFPCFGFGKKDKK